MKWNENARLLVAINIDLDTSGKGVGAKGKGEIGIYRLECRTLISIF